jgi:hypothetical protein
MPRGPESREEASHPASANGHTTNHHPQIPNTHLGSDPMHGPVDEYHHREKHPPNHGRPVYRNNGPVGRG